MKLNYIEFKNFRSFGNEWVRIENPSKINILIGPNNSGKTNILRFIEILGKLRGNLSSAQIDQPMGLSGIISSDDFYQFRNHNLEIKICFDLDEKEKAELYGALPHTNLYVHYELSENRFKLIRTSINEITDTGLLQNFQQQWIRAHGGGTSGGDLGMMQTTINQQLHLSRFIAIPETFFVGEYRKLTGDKELRNELKNIISPTHLTRSEQQPRKEALYALLKVIFDADCVISVPDIEQEIQIEINSFQQPLSSVGAGIQEIILLGFYLITKQDAIFCIDEPETHLHPAAQRRFLDYISKNTRHTYYVATHSNHFLDFAVKEKSIYIVKKSATDTGMERVESNGIIRNALDDLGIRASEIYQTNGIIWVEGPSDRIYIKQWLEMKYPEYQEGLNYAFQYYGGRILSHYSLTDAAFKEYLNILEINRNAYVVMDSDQEKEYEEKDLRDTKQRIILECKKNDIGFWITKGREIENYLSDDLLSQIEGAAIKRDIYRPIKEYTSRFGKIPKVDFAREVVGQMTVDEFNSNGDLSDKIDKIAEAIKRWNR